MFSILVCCFIFLSPGIGADASQTTNEFLFMFLSHSGHWWSRPSDLSRLSDSQHRSTCIARPNHRTLILVFYVFGIAVVTSISWLAHILVAWFEWPTRMTNNKRRMNHWMNWIDIKNTHKRQMMTKNHSETIQPINPKKRWRNSEINRKLSSKSTWNGIDSLELIFFQNFGLQIENYSNSSCFQFDVIFW